MRLIVIGAMAAVMGTSPLAAHPKVTSTKPVDRVSGPARGAAAAVDAFHGALRRGDQNAAAALLAEDAVIFESGGVERTKAEYAASHLPADAEFSRNVSSVVTHRMGASQGASAWIASEGRTTGTYKGKPVDILTTETMILRRMREGWRIVHVHWSSAARH